MQIVIQRYKVDLYSDTKSQPTPEMRKAIAMAEAGDEQHQECPIVSRLCEMVAHLLGQEDAMFLPSGTMANEIALLTQTRPGDEIIAHRDAHIANFEGGAPSALAGVGIRSVLGERGIFNAAAVRQALRPNVHNLPRSTMIVVEQTTNLGGGAIWSLDDLSAVEEVARSAGLAMHLDGARLFNAAVGSGVAPANYASRFDTAWIDFTKGLGAPFGAVLAGSREVIGEAWRWKQRLGGSMRQVGMMAAGCIYALDHHVERLAIDHMNASNLANGLLATEILEVEPVETNMVFVDVSRTGFSAAEFNARLIGHEVRLSVQGPMTLRAVTHLDVDAAGIDLALSAVRTVLADAPVATASPR